VDENGDIAELTVDDLPDEQSEFDTDGDGLPDNFFSVTNPEKLFNSFKTTLETILIPDRDSNSTVTAFAGSNSFENIVVQTTFQESVLSDQEELIWTGNVFAYFIDQFGIFREDTNNNGALDDVDQAFRFDSTNGSMLIERLNVTFGANGIPESVDPIGSLFSINDLDSLWDAGERLQVLNNDFIPINRTYDAPVPPDGREEPGRYIFTYIDENSNGLVDETEQLIFDRESLFNGSATATDRVAYFGVEDTRSAGDIVDFIRGFEASNSVLLDSFDPTLNFRNRTLAIDVENSSEPKAQTFRLGDIVNSRPLIVAGPSEGYDTQFGDDSYAAFAEVYANRRQVSYVGANDGLLHAFNNGFREQGTAVVAPGESETTNHPLGAEIWAYAPFNLLPHLQFLTLPNYAHQFYVDGSPRSFDVKIFDHDPDDCSFNPDTEVAESLNASCRYINGWGTILIVGMRLGGGDFPLKDAFGNPLEGLDGNDFITRSSYIIIDITNPELPPKVLAEVNHPDLNFATSDLDIFYDCGSNCDIPAGSTNSSVDSGQIFDGSWKLVFGSGPNDVREFTTTETAKVFSYDLETQNLEVEEVSSADNSFVGGITAQDWDNGSLGFRNDDVAYFGTVQSTPSINPITGDITESESGSVFRYFPEEIPQGVFDSVNLLIDIDRPVFEAPVALSNGALGSGVLASWVHIGTGIFLTRENANITDEEHFFGVIEPVDINEIDDLANEPLSLSRENSTLLTYDPVNVSDLHNVTGVEVLTAAASNSGIAGELSTPENVGGVSVTTIDGLAQAIVDGTQGWIRSLPNNAGADFLSPSARITGAAVPFNSQLFFSAFTPEGQSGIGICNGEAGSSSIFALNQTTGTASTVGTFGNDGELFEVMSDPIGGNINSPIIFNSEGLFSNNGAIITQADNSAITPAPQDGDGSDNGEDNDAIDEQLCFPIKTKDNDFVMICF